MSATDEFFEQAEREVDAMAEDAYGDNNYEDLIFAFKCARASELRLQALVGREVDRD